MHSLHPMVPRPLLMAVVLVLPSCDDGAGPQEELDLFGHPAAPVAGAL
jgi:hypothetical protein